MADRSPVLPNAPEALDLEPDWRSVLRGFAPFALLAVLLAVLVSRHADFVRTSVTVVSVLGIVSWAWKLPGDNLPKRFTLMVARVLARRATAITLWSCLALVSVASLFLGSLHVVAPTAPDHPVWVYRVSESLDAPRRPVIDDSLELDHLHPHRDFYLIPSSHRRVWLMTSDYQRTEPVVIRPWTAITLGYRDQFTPIVAVAFLPLESYLAFIGKGRPLRVFVEDQLSGDTLAADSLTNGHAMPALVLSFAGAPPVDSTIFSRWFKLALPVAGGDSTSATGVAKNWSAPHWLRAKRDLKVGDRLRLVLLKSSGSLVADDTLTIQTPFSDALVIHSS